MHNAASEMPAGETDKPLNSADRPEIRRLSRALTFPTVAGYPRPENEPAFIGLLDFITGAFPTLFAAARITREDPWRLVVEVEGSDRSLLPVLMLGHFDVVGVPAESKPNWIRPPFSGDVYEGYVWGRGAIDDKCSVMAILEAADRLVSTGRVPSRGLVMAFGGDEELSGHRGAKQTAAGFRDRGRRFHFIMEEASVIADGILGGTTAPLALIGLTEKGIADISVTVRAQGGHAGRPPVSTAVGMLSRAIAKIESNPFPIRRISSVEGLFRAAGRVAKGITGFAYRHPRLMWPLMARRMSSNPATNAVIRTSQAVTMVAGGTAPNVLPQQASCVINARILPGDTVESVLQHYRGLLEGMNAQIDLVDGEAAFDPAPETPPDHEGFLAIGRSLGTVAPGVVAAPYILTDSTDSKYYSDLSDGTLRFVPVTLVAEDLPRVHGDNERIGTEDYLRMISFYSDLFGKVCWYD